MRDLVELASSIDPELPDRKRREEFCNLLLDELMTLKGRDLAPYLSECVFDTIAPGTRLVLKFPLGAHIFKPFERDAKGPLKSNDCALRHIKVFRERALGGEVADFGEPCQTCIHKEKTASSRKQSISEKDLNTLKEISEKLIQELFCPSHHIEKRG